MPRRRSSWRPSEALEIWGRTEAEVEGERVRIGRDALMALIDQAPQTYVQHARNPERSVTVGGRHSVISPSYGPPFILSRSEASVTITRSSTVL